MRYIILLMFIILNGIMITLSAQPEAKIVSSSQEICSQAATSVVIELTGTAPFKLQYQIFYKSEPSKLTNYTTDGIYPDLDKKLTIMHSLGEDKDDVAVVKLLKIRDKTMSEDQWIDIPADQFLNFQVYKKPVPEVTLSDDKCGYTSQLTATNNNLKSPSYKWEAIGGGSVTPTNALSTTFTASDAGDYSVRFTEKNGVCEVTKDIPLLLWGYPKGNISGSTVICTDPQNTDVKQITIDVALTGNAPFQYTLSNGTKRSVANSSDNFILHPERGGDILIASIADANGCMARPSDRTGAARVIDRIPTPSAGADVNICGDVATLKASISKAGNAGRWSFVKAGDGEFASDPGSEEVSVKTYRNGLVGMRWTETNNDGSACSADDIANIRFDLPVESVDAGPDTVLYMQDRYIMKGRLKAWEQGEWSVVSGGSIIKDVNDYNAVVESLTVGVHTFRWTVSNGICLPQSAMVDIDVRNLKWPNAFSPNGDGVNDQLVILGAPHIRNNELVVFDQKGKIVYRKANYENTWEGKDDSGHNLPDGYYYYIFSGENIATIKESLIIKRTKN